MLIIPLVLTVMIEIMVLLIFNENRKKVFIASVVMNVITNLSLNIFIRQVDFQSARDYHLTVIVLELIIWSLESFGYYLVTKEKIKSLKYGVCCNGVSYLTGLILIFISTI